MAIFEANIVRVILSAIVLIVLIVIVIRFRAGKQPDKDSIEMLKERYEKGEITEEEYEDARKRRGK
jgi:putative membrane protein